MKSVAVLGAGIAGLAAAHFLSRRHRVHVFEKEPMLGGPTNTVMVDGPDGVVALDTGFLVHNHRTYPNLVRLFGELGVATRDSDMSFAVSCRRTSLEYSSRGANGFFAQRRNLVRPSHLALLRAIARFNLFPMASAIWSASFEAIRSFPALTLIRFFDKHGLLSPAAQPTWKVVAGGSHTYIPGLVSKLSDAIHRDASIQSVQRREDGVTLTFRDRPSMRFDDVVFACHGDQVLPMLDDPSDREREILTRFTTTTNVAWLHTDASVLPARRRARASWNYLLAADAEAAPIVTYDLNRLQGLRTTGQFCVTLNPDGRIDERDVLRRFVYRHPLYTREAIRAQQRWREVSGVNRTHYCGAYWFHGFHEDGLNSALSVSRALGVEW